MAGFQLTLHGRIWVTPEAKLTPSFHVYGITRRGFGQSGFSPEGYGADRLGDDVLTVLDCLELKKPVLVGHSLGGEELSSLATRHPNRVAGLVYLEAGYPYAFDNGKGPSMKEFLDARKLMPQAPPSSESDPGLASFAIPHGQAKWVDESTDPKVRQAAKAFSAAELALTTRQAKAFEDGIPTAHIVRMRGADHYVYLSNEADVLREMKSFLNTLQ